jgi:hypothetical protein
LGTYSAAAALGLGIRQAVSGPRSDATHSASRTRRRLNIDRYRNSARCAGYPPSHTRTAHPCLEKESDERKAYPELARVTLGNRKP